MLTVGQVRAEVARVAYRPGWSLTVEERGFEDPWLRIVAPVADGYDPDRVMDLGIESPIPPMADLAAGQGGKPRVPRVLPGRRLPAVRSAPSTRPSLRRPSWLSCS
jgi:hypothetical protein